LLADHGVAAGVEPGTLGARPPIGAADDVGNAAIFGLMAPPLNVACARLIGEALGATVFTPPIAGFIPRAVTACSGLDPGIPSLCDRLIALMARDEGSRMSAMIASRAGPIVLALAKNKSAVNQNVVQ
jgi:hypothetical protein